MDRPGALAVLLLMLGGVRAPAQYMPELVACQEWLSRGVPDRQPEALLDGWLATLADRGAADELVLAIVATAEDLSLSAVVRARAVTLLQYCGRWNRIELFAASQQQGIARAQLRLSSAPDLLPEARAAMLVATAHLPAAAAERREWLLEGQARLRRFLLAPAAPHHDLQHLAAVVDYLRALGADARQAAPLLLELLLAPASPPQLHSRAARALAALAPCLDGTSVDPALLRLLQALPAADNRFDGIAAATRSLASHPDAFTDRRVVARLAVLPALGVFTLQQELQVHELLAAIGVRAPEAVAARLFTALVDRSLAAGPADSEPVARARSAATAIVDSKYHNVFTETMAARALLLLLEDFKPPPANARLPESAIPVLHLLTRHAGKLGFVTEPALAAAIQTRCNSIAAVLAASPQPTAQAAARAWARATAQ